MKDANYRPGKIEGGDGIMVNRQGYLEPVNMREFARKNNTDIQITHNHSYWDRDPIGIFAEGTADGKSRLDFVYSLFDSLIEKDTYYGSKRTIAEDEWGNPLVEYRFRAWHNVGKQAAFHDSARTPRRILVLGQLHGQEASSMITFFLMLDEILTSWTEDKWCNWAYNNIEFVILPAGNPSGVIRNNRRNQNNVDLNRNFPTDWLRTDSTTRGKAPGSEKDTQNIIDWVTSYRGENIGMIELHDHSDGALVWGVAHHPMMFRIYTDALRDLSEWLYTSELWGYTNRPSRTYRGAGPGWVGRATWGGCTRHMVVGLQQPSILVEHPYIDHKLTGPGNYWGRVAYRLIMRSIITRLHQNSVSTGFYEEFYD